MECTIIVNSGDKSHINVFGSRMQNRVPFPCMLWLLRSPAPALLSVRRLRAVALPIRFVPQGSCNNPPTNGTKRMPVETQTQNPNISLFSFQLQKKVMLLIHHCLPSPRCFVMSDERGHNLQTTQVAYHTLPCVQSPWRWTVVSRGPRLSVFELGPDLSISQWDLARPGVFGVLSIFEQLFSSMNHVKIQHRSRLTDGSRPTALIRGCAPRFRSKSPINEVKLFFMDIFAYCYFTLFTDKRFPPSVFSFTNNSG